MSLASAQDVPLRIASDGTASERRVSPAWTIEQFKARMEPVTGIPPSSQSLTLRLGGSHPAVSLTAADEATTPLSSFPLQAYAEIHVADTRPPGARESFTDTASVQKYTMNQDTYESLSDTVLSFKRQNKLGRFDPAAPDIVTQKAALIDREVDERHITVGSRCQLLPPTPTSKEDSRRGTVRFIGLVPEIPNSIGSWVGIELDEPVGKNDGSVGGTKYFDCKPKYGVMVRPSRVEIGNFEALDELGEEMEEM